MSEEHMDEEVNTSMNIFFKSKSKEISNLFN